MSSNNLSSRLKTVLTFCSVGQQSCRLQRKDSDEAQARPLCDVHVQRQVLDELSRPQTQTELVAAQSPWQQLFIGQREGHPGS